MSEINDLKSNILKVSTELFVNQGYDKTTIRQIAEASGIGRGHLYYYFRKKEDILIYIFKKLLNKIYTDVIDINQNMDEIILSYAAIQCAFIYTLVFNEKLFRIYIQGSNVEIVRREAQNILSDLCKKEAQKLKYNVSEKDIFLSIVIGYAAESELLKRYYNGEKYFDIDLIIKSIVSTRLLLLNIISRKQIDDIVDKAIEEAKKFDYNNMVSKLYYFKF